MIITGKEIKALAEFVGLGNIGVVDEEVLETEIVISEEKKLNKKIKLAYFYDYPEEGSICLDDF